VPILLGIWGLKVQCLIVPIPLVLTLNFIVNTMKKREFQVSTAITNRLIHCVNCMKLYQQ
jgi:hypothetical protein